MIRSPRFIRPHRILIRNKVAELDGVAKYQTTTMNHVCVDASYGMKQLQKGIQPIGDLLVIVDMNDLVAFEGAKKRIYKEPREFEKLENTESHFTLRPDVDLIVYKDLKIPSCIVSRAMMILSSTTHHTQGFCTMGI